MRKLLYVTCIASLSIVFLLQAVDAKKKRKSSFEWEEITDADWAVTQDSARQIFDAAMLFEKVDANDEDLTDSKCYRRIYRRIRILNESGRDRANVSVPFFHTDQKITKIRARSVLPDGTITQLQEENVFDKEVVKTTKINYNQTNFSIPGVSDDCIIEYLISVRTPYGNTQWPIQKDIPLLTFEFHWTPAKWEVTRRQMNRILSDPNANIPVPKYLWFNKHARPTIEQLPSPEETNEYRFLTTNVPPFDEEPSGLPSEFLKEKLMCFYGSSLPSAKYWGRTAAGLETFAVEFCEKRRCFEEIVEGFGELDSDSARIHAAYNWAQANITNITYTDLYDKDDVEKKKKKKPSERKSIDDMIQKGYGSSVDIHVLFWALLNEMEVDAKLAFAKERTEDLFVRKATYWQFDNSAVMVVNEQGLTTFYTPGIACTPPSHVPWYLEGVHALVGGYDEFFVTIPISTAELHRSLRSAVLKITEDYEIVGEISNRQYGHVAQITRADLYDEAPQDYHQILKETIEKEYATIQLDSISVEGADSVSQPITVSFTADFSPVTPMGGQLLLRPMEYFTVADNLFLDPEREGSLMFQRAINECEAAEFALPEGWSIDAVPSDTSFSNAIGECAVRFSVLGGKLMVQRMFVMNRPLWPLEAYTDVRKLYQTRQEFSDLTVILVEDTD